MELSVDRVCEFLQNRCVHPNVVAAFKENKVDAKVVRLLDDSQLDSLGLKTLGDRALLKDFCTCVFSAPVTLPSNADMTRNDHSVAPVASDIGLHRLEKKKRKQELLHLLRGKDSDTKKKVTTGQKVGRPKSISQTVKFGLRVKDEEDNPDGSKFRLIRSPLGDLNLISILINVDEDYETLLNTLIKAFFPNGSNDVIGASKKYYFDIVNGRNQIVSECLQSPFSLCNYRKERMVSGSLKLYLLCKCMHVPNSDNDASSDDVTDDSDELPVFSTVDLTSVESWDHLQSSALLPSTANTVTSQLLQQNTCTSTPAPVVSTFEQSPNVTLHVPVMHVPLDEPNTSVNSGTVTSFLDIYLPTPDTGQSDATPYLPLTPSGEILARSCFSPRMTNVPSWKIYCHSLEETLQQMELSGDPVEILKTFQGLLLQGRPFSCPAA